MPSPHFTTPHFCGVARGVASVATPPTPHFKLRESVAFGNIAINSHSFQFVLELYIYPSRGHFGVPIKAKSATMGGLDVRAPALAASENDRIYIQWVPGRVCKTCVKRLFVRVPGHHSEKVGRC